MNLRDRNLRFVLLKAVADAIAAELDNERADHTLDLVERYDDEGTKSFDCKLPDGTKVATISLAVPQPKTDVVDADALVKWAQANHQDWMVKTIVVPAVPEHTVVVPAEPERTEHSLDRDAVEQFLAACKPVSGAEPGPVVHEETGSLVDGVKHTPSGKPKSFSVRYAGDGRDELGRAWRRGDLEHLTTGSVLPALGTAS